MQKSSFKRVAIVSFLVILVCIPLFISFQNIKTNNNIKIKARNYIENFILENNLDYIVYSVNVLNAVNPEIYLKVELEVPENYEV
jgi:ATP/ADP translocase